MTQPTHPERPRQELERCWWCGDDREYQRWLADLTAVVQHKTWSAIPALLRFPHAEPDVVLQLAASEGQTALVTKILESFPGAVEPGGLAAAGAAVTAASRGTTRPWSRSWTTDSTRTQWTSTTRRSS